ncbi:hypothetical protein PLEOSDRAFT_1110068 [Pleurotus ostreatus PC15]|uniref:Uncharacterized protein n=1 Tax=Pleurotus ostreatus (strain PC15) TaxID=1137138 RepID=A0A067NGU4_PLEO1|nr:hypothetical protein PLEOSDRAFT_1110068 [Pleurotus ostreatus PC15]
MASAASVRDSSRLPNEILITIVDELGKSDAPKALHSLLLVSRHFHAIAIRPIYKEMLLSLFHPKQIPAFAYLSRNIATNPGVQFITSFIFIFEYYSGSGPCFTTGEVGAQENLELILPYLVNVKRLHITFWPFGVFNPQALCLLPPGVQLTHLFVDRSLHLTDLSPFLALSHPLLESIVIRPAYPSAATCQPFQPTDPKLSVGALCPNLRCLEAPIEDFLLFEDAPPSLVNLGVRGQHPFRFVDDMVLDHIVHTFPSLRTLYFEGTNFGTGVAPLLPRLPNLEYLSLDHSSMSRRPDAHNLSMFSAVAKLKYLRLTYSPRGEPCIAPGIVDTLLILDVVKFKTCTRVYKDSLDTSQVELHSSRWLQWWEPAEQDIANTSEQHNSSLFVKL